MSEEEIINVDADKMSELNQKTRLHRSSLFDAVGIVGKNGPIVENEKIHNVFNLSSVGRPFKTEKDFSFINGNATSITADKVSDITKYTTVSNVTFIGTESAQQTRLVIIRRNARGVFIGCSFRRPSRGEGATMVELEAGATAIFLGCQFFRGTFPILNGAAAAACQVIGCSQGDLGAPYNDPSGSAVTVIGSLF